MESDNDTEDSQKQSFSLGRVIAALLLIVGYPLSFGPFVWLSSHDMMPGIVGIIYQPLFWVYSICPEPVQAVFEAYLEWWAA
jgi:hypothetical protein